jgi:hypothetical protein
MKHTSPVSSRNRRKIIALYNVSKREVNTQRRGAEPQRNLGVRVWDVKTGYALCPRLPM